MIETFYEVVKKKSLAMQDNIINILDFMLNKCNIKGHKMNNEAESKQKCLEIFKNSQFINAIIMGLKCDSSFVRLKFIKFVEMYVPYLRKFDQSPEFREV